MDESYIKRILSTVFDEARPQGLGSMLDKLEQKVESGSPDLQMVAHKMVGTAQMVGAIELSKLLRSFEKNPRLDAIPDLRDTYNKTRKHLISEGLLPL